MATLWSPAPPGRAGTAGLGLAGLALCLSLGLAPGRAAPGEGGQPPEAAAATPAAGAAGVVGIDAEQLSCFAGGVAGGVAGGDYLDAEAIAGHFAGTTQYRLYSLAGAAGEAVAPGPPVDEGGEGECAALWRHELALDPRAAGAFLVGLHRPPGVTAEALPKILELAETPRPEHVELMADFLRRRNVADPVVEIVQAIRTDLDGDGGEDWILNAVHHKPDEARKGDYSVILVLRSLGGGTRTHVVQDEITLADSPYASTLWVNRVVAVLDIDGDGVMEIVTNGVYVYGGGWEVIRFENGSFEHVLFCGCDG